MWTCSYSEKHEAHWSENSQVLHSKDRLWSNWSFFTEEFWGNYFGGIHAKILPVYENTFPMLWKRDANDTANILGLFAYSQLRIQIPVLFFYTRFQLFCHRLSRLGSQYSIIFKFLCQKYVEYKISSELIAPIHISYWSNHFICIYHRENQGSRLRPKHYYNNTE